MTKILLVEDDKSLREIYGVRLLAEGYDIVSAGDGEEALAMAIKDRPDLIVSDVMMPKISGFDMLDILRSTTETKNIKVIMMTALSSEEQRQRGVSLGADRYLVKSQVGIEDVVRTVHEVLADAPITGQAPLVSTPAPVPSPAPAPVPEPTPAPITPSPIVVPPRPTPVSYDAAIAPTPVQTVAPAPQVQVEPAPQVVAPAPEPIVSVPAPAPVPATAPLPQSVLPQPTAPFSTPRQNNSTLADRVIQPLETNNQNTPDFGNLIDQELGAHPQVPASSDADIQFEETPLPPQQPAPNSNVPLPPAPPAPNAGI